MRYLSRLCGEDIVNVWRPYAGTYAFLSAHSVVGMYILYNLGMEKKK